MSINFNPVDLFILRERSARFWCVLFLVSVVGFGVERCHLVGKLQSKPRFVVIDEDTIYLPKSLDFLEAEEVHLAQGELVTQSLLNKHSGGVDSPERLRRLFNKEAYQKVQVLLTKESREFERKSLHQKVEIADTNLLTLKDESARLAISGQLIRIGMFEGRKFTEVLAFKLHLEFVNNPTLRGNGGFPTIVRDFELQTTPLSSR